MTSHGPTSRWWPVVLGFVVAVCIVMAAGLTWVLLAPAGAPERGPRPTSAGSRSATGSEPAGSEPATGSEPAAGSGPAARSEPLAGVQRVLDRRAAAARAGDESAWLADLDPSAAGLRQRQRALLSALRSLQVRELTLRAERFLPGPAVRPDGSVGDEAARVDVVGAWLLPGVDAQPAPFTLELTVRRGGGGWVVVDDSGERTVRQAFDLPGLQVLRTPAGVVAGNAPRERLEEVSADLAGSREHVERAWGAFAHLPAVVLPATAAEFTALTGRVGRDTSGVAAVTYGMLETSKTSRGDRIVVNPVAWGSSTRQGRRIILTHELTHLAGRATTTHPVPEWLSEGYAVHTSYAGLQVDPRRAAPELMAGVAEGALPTRLPADERFGDMASGTAYDEAWLLVDWLARTRGEEALRRLYRDMGSGSARSDALGRIGLTESTLLAGWQEDLRRLAR